MFPVLWLLFDWMYVQPAIMQMNAKELRAEAQKLGVDADAIENARDGDDPKGELIKLIEANVSGP